MGLTEDDIKAIQTIDGDWRAAEGAYSTDVICGENEIHRKFSHMESMNTEGQSA